MRFTPRSTEYQAVEDILEDESYETARQMAKDIVSAVWVEMSFREQWVLAVYDGRRLATTYGPYPSEGEAQRAARTLGGSYGYEVVALAPSGLLEANLNGKPGGGFGYCKAAKCGHAPWLHLAGERGGMRGRCAETKCPCKGYKK